MTTPPTRLRWKAGLRTLHIYFSLFGLILTLFFATTGFIMNHEEWFEVPPRQEPTAFGQVPLELLAGPDRLAIVELLRSRYGASGPLAEFEVEDEALHVSFRKPGRSTDAVIHLDDGYVTVDVEIEGVVEAIGQLHQGKRSGLVGSLVLDFAAFTLAITALSGLALWTTLPRRRTAGYVVVTAAVLLAATLWWYLVL